MILRLSALRLVHRKDVSRAVRVLHGSDLHIVVGFVALSGLVDDGHLYRMVVHGDSDLSRDLAGRYGFFHKNLALLHLHHGGSAGGFLRRCPKRHGCRQSEHDAGAAERNVLSYHLATFLSHFWFTAGYAVALPLLYRICGDVSRKSGERDRVRGELRFSAGAKLIPLRDKTADTASRVPTKRTAKSKKANIKKYRAEAKRF